MKPGRCAETELKFGAVAGRTGRQASISEPLKPSDEGCIKDPVEAPLTLSPVQAWPNIGRRTR